MKRRLLLLLMAFIATSYSYGQYCSASGGGDEYISGVEIGSISNTGTGADGYHDYTALSTDLYVGQSGVSITITNGTPYASDDVGVWIDWNQDSDFEDADENVVCKADNGGQGTFTFNVPAGATLGNTVMRVRIKYYDADCGSPCGTTDYGEVEDYTINVTTPPSCPAPSAQTESNITTSGADLSWTENGSATTWNIEWGPTGFAQGSGTQVTVTTNPTYSLSGLTASTTYDWYVRADCGGSTSTWTGPSTFTTVCETVSSFPYTTDFENGGSIPSCWTNDAADAGGEWEFVTTSSHGATADHTTGIGYYALLNDYSVQVANSPFNLLTPTFDLSSGGPYQMTYWAWIGPNGDANPIHVDVSDDGGATWTTDVYVNDKTTTSSWFENTVTLSSFTTNNVIIRFRGVSIWGSGTDNSGIDDVTIEEMPACPAPSAQTESDITATTVNLGWTEIGSATSWNIEYGQAGFTPTGTPTVTGVPNPYTLTGLTASTTYDWYVQSDCGSTWTGPSTFTTACATVSTLSEDFTGSSTPSCWANDGVESWLFSTGADYGATSAGDHTPGGGTNYAWIDGSSGVGTNELLTPYIDVSGFTTPAFEFYYFSNNTNNSGDDNTLTVDFWDGAAWNTLLTYSGDDPSWQQGLYDLSAYTITGDVRFRFVVTGTATTTYYNDILIDDVSVEEMPSCPPPSSQTTDSLKLNSAQLSWTETSSATEWNIRIGTTGYDTTGTSYSVVTNDTITVDTLLASTTYDWYVRASCGGGDYSSWIGPQSFTTSSGLATGPYPADGASGVLVSSDTLKWNPVAGATKYVLKVGTTSGGNDIFSNIGTTDTAFIAGSNWDYSTQYYWSVNTVYNGTNDTVTGTEWDFSTECGANIPTYSQDFASYLPLCWTEAEGFLTTNSTLTGTSSSWTQDDFANVAINGKSAKLDIWGTSKKEWLISPTIDLSGGNYQLEFDLALTHYGTTNADTLGSDDTLAVIISTDDGATWSTSKILKVWTASTLISNTGEHVVINLPFYSSSTTKFAFYGASTVSNKDNDVFIDNFTVQIPPSCPAPSAQATDSIKLNAAQLSWTENGSATEWNVRIGTSGYDTTGTSYSVVTNDTITVDTLLASTTYDWYVRASCGGGDYSSWIGPQTFTTSAGLATGPYPADGASGVLVSSDTLKWNPVSGATKYVLNVGTTSGGDDVLSGYSITDTAYIKGSDWDYSTQYYWSVNTVYNGIDDTVTGTEWSFRTACQATSVPYFEDFDAVTAPAFPSCMTVENTNLDAYEWETSAGGLSSPNAAKIRYNSAKAMDDWFFTRGLQLTGGVTYEVQFAYKEQSSNYTEKLAVDWGNAASSTAMSGTPIFDNNVTNDNNWLIGSGTFTPSASGTYYVGFHGHSDADQWNLYVDDIQVAEQQTTTTWNGTVSNDWDDAGNWSSGVPTSNTDVTIPTGATNYPTLSHARQCNNLTIESDANGDGSLIGAAYLNINGTATVERYIPDGNAWHNIASPVDGATLNVLYSNNFNVFVQEYTESTNLWTYVTDLSTAFPFGKGFNYALASGHTNTVEFQGALRTTDLTLDASSTPPIEFTSAPDKGYNFIGNPFTSAIKWGYGSWTLTNINDQVWVYDFSAGTYKYYVSGTSTGSLTDGIIPMGQGFFIQANAASPSITIPLDAQVHSSQDYYSPQRSSSPAKLGINVSKGEKNDEVWIVFIDGATEGYENGYDGRKLFGSEESPQLYTVEDAEIFSIDALPPLELNDSKVVKLFCKAGESGEQTMVANTEGLDGIEVTLEDLKLNYFQNLNDDPVYVFDANSYQNPDRFRLHFTRVVTGIDKDKDSELQVYSYNDAIYIKSVGELAKTDKEVIVYDIYGRRVLQTNVLASTLERIPLHANNSYFIVKTIADGKVYISKVFIK